MQTEDKTTSAQPRVNRRTTMNEETHPVTDVITAVVMIILTILALALPHLHFR